MILTYELVPRETKEAIAAVIKSPDRITALHLIADTEFERLPEKIRALTRMIYKTRTGETRQLADDFATHVLDYINGKI
jgi:hypothetical protein